MPQIPGIHWEVVVSRPTSAAFATQIILRRIVLIAAGTFFLIGLFFWLTLTFLVIQPIERLAPISEAIGLTQPLSNEEKNYLIKQARRDDQIGHLIRSVMRMEEFHRGTNERTSHTLGNQYGSDLQPRA